MRIASTRASGVRWCRGRMLLFIFPVLVAKTLLTSSRKITAALPITRLHMFAKLQLKRTTYTAVSNLHISLRTTYISC